MSDLSENLASVHAGSAHATGPLFEQVYAELKRLAHSRLRGSSGLMDLDTTALVHESFLLLTERGHLRAADRPAFFCYVGRVMRSVVIDHVRSQQAAKRGGDFAIITLTTGVESEPALDDERLLAMDAALDALERVAPDYHRLVEMRYFAGLSIREVAEIRSTSTRTVEREWEKARAFLHQLMQEH